MAVDIAIGRTGCLVQRQGDYWRVGMESKFWSVADTADLFCWFEVNNSVNQLILARAIN